jgi:hypothetical protein
MSEAPRATLLIIRHIVSALVVVEGRRSRSGEVLGAMKRGARGVPACRNHVRAIGLDATDGSDCTI